MRLELTKRGDYAVRAMIALACDDAGLHRAPGRSPPSMAIPPRFLPQVMARPGAGGPRRGRDGEERRLQAVRPAAEISLLTIVEAVEGTSRRETCVLRGGPCGRDGACAVHAAFCAAEEAMIGGARLRHARRGEPRRPGLDVRSRLSRRRCVDRGAAAAGPAP